ncbi:hypothetical protein [uncultured Hyphomonas sp.]|uniref:hypothetical protein n=1 Tax=uncultured Hyphomonas sp. TaxID=225298 RepID=UPI002AAC2D57|nr:hypothetical protein [uncultured Hyphomonas sp.]
MKCPKCGSEDLNLTFAHHMTRSMGGIGGGLVGGAMTGAAVGSVVPIFGTILGGAAGWLIAKNVAKEASGGDAYSCKECNHKFVQ